MQFVMFAEIGDHFFLKAVRNGELVLHGYGDIVQLPAFLLVEGEVAELELYAGQYGQAAIYAEKILEQATDDMFTVADK